MRNLPAALAALGIVSAVFAQPPDRGQQPPAERTAAAQRTAPADRQRLTQPPRFEAVDKNGDGALDRKEARAVDGLKFSDADADGNSSIDPREYAIAMAKVLEGWRR